MLLFVGAGLLGFYRIHMLEVVTPEFIIVPMVSIHFIQILANQLDLLSKKCQKQQSCKNKPQKINHDEKI